MQGVGNRKKTAETGPPEETEPKRNRKKKVGSKKKGQGGLRGGIHEK